MQIHRWTYVFDHDHFLGGDADGLGNLLSRGLAPVDLEEIPLLLEDALQKLMQVNWQPAPEYTALIPCLSHSEIRLLSLPAMRPAKIWRRAQYNTDTLNVQRIKHGGRWAGASPDDFAQVCDGPRDGLPDPPRGICAEFEALGGVKFLDAAQKAHHALLDQV